ncbi:MAG TPA: hypothetical protein VFA12_03195 [Stellaceae bacterium]|nr:hypothetical protein [Stellaceae bacterium]
MVRSLLAMAAAVLLAGTAANAGCPAAAVNGKAKTHARAGAADCIVSFKAVPEISKKIVADEQKGKIVPRPTFAEPVPEPYTGPTVGASGSAVGTIVRRAPEIGYKWSID